MADPTWIDRLQDRIYLTSPTTGTKFEAYYIGNTYDLAKRLGQFNYPLVDGTTVQDLGISSAEVTISIYFEGPDNDIHSWKFVNALAERGPWDVVHPLRGDLSLQLISAQLHDEPVTSGNVTVVDTKWIIPAKTSNQISVTDLSRSITDASDTTNTQAASTFSKISNAINLAAKAYGVITQAIGTVGQIASTITSTYQSAITQANALMASLSTNYNAVATLIQTAIEAPGVISGDIAGQLSLLLGAGKTMASAPETLTTPLTDATTAQLAASDLCLTSVATAMCLSTVNTSITSVTEDGITIPTTRATILDSINFLITAFTAFTASLDDAAALYSTSPMAQQYISMSASWPDLQNLFSLTVQYLESIMFTLNSEITFTLSVERAPISIAADYYGQNGWDDSYFDLFIASNHLVGDQVNLLPAGFQVVIYQGAEVAV